MRIFITGASGYVGGVVTEHLVRAGHEVVALARSDRARERVEALGAKAVPGGLRDLDVLRAGAADVDAVVHTAVDYFDAGMGDIERDALHSMLDGLKEGAAFLYTSTALVYPDTQGVTVDEEHPVDPHGPQPFKILGERQVLGAGHVAGTVIRAGLVYGRAGSGLLQGLLASARQQGMVAYIGEGTNEWSSVHVDDLAALYTAVLARRSPRTVVNAAGAERTPMRGIVEAVAAAAGARAVSVTPEQAAETMGPVAALLTRSSPLDSAKARRLFGWNPTSPNLLDELTSGSYVQAST
ncbi:nucleoside-diphosphate-sugar epimerase [Streptosporangium becharense]|uniref:Nucleoside-diphosphate-sugar epimerase n=1 Tax=Streptosporangium becharense TaxID=1816182 RepID=A0A7W9IHU7_9ACTN|nr:NAD-dependent epimerase/dehydratase family protein [Streptosporangium becharense]MBB2912456.1 nucleoside-diphosphate-sugar epimerase [Streptosporangium becharense]MBB5820715.1 nucleoside-diphosphate-sugar epimerase [Streptosporangium becharense]